MDIKQLLVIIILSFFLVTPVSAEDGESLYIEPVSGIEFILVKGGTFTMGDITGRDKAASPAHRVTVDDFYIGKYEVTFEQYDKFCDETKREKPSDEGWGRGNRPVIHISWSDASAYAAWLSKKSGRAVRLPSETEWEYAARGGTGSRFWWGNQPGAGLANCFDCESNWAGKSTAPVGSFRANPIGLYDMNGNVYEWCLDTMHRNYAGAPTDGSAWSGGNTKKHISRSGSWLMPAKEMTAFARSWDPTEERNNTIGMRLVLEP